jgi:endonuclease/exonuclease/phosphatase family metal-dependent hydrolase
MAQLLECNYVYYPAIRHTMNDKNFGNAILSRWPLRAPEKIILPHADIKRSQKRIAVGATVLVDTLEVRAYSVHTENLWLEPEKRIEQSDSLGRNVSERYSRLIVGGDFNTVTKPTLEATEAVFSGRGLKRVSREAGATVKFGPLSVASDHIFAKGLDAVGAGVAADAKASDHTPVWVLLKPL